MQKRMVGRAGGLTSTLTVCAVLAGAPGATAQVVPQHAPKHRLTAQTSTNWSGYSVDGSNATVVTGNWTVQKASCGRHETSWSSPWVGIDGDTSSTVEQTGTDTDCNGGTPSYYAWWEMYPAPTQVFPDTIKSGDSMTGTVTYTGSGNFTMTLVDHSAGWTETATANSTKASRSSVEWIVEGPSNGTLTDFGTLNFSTDSATINGTSQSLDQFGSAANAITMTTKKGVVRAQPGTLGSGGSFADTWYHA